MTNFFIEIVTPVSQIIEKNWKWIWTLNICSLQIICKKIDRSVLHNDWKTNSIKPKPKNSYSYKTKLYIEKHYGPMYIYFDDYPQYTDEIYRIFETKLMQTLISVIDTPT